jgi:exopolyphosphatase/guanosine-5'-triphosphate,3'-diphosphate pyrophosphatase
MVIARVVDGAMQIIGRLKQRVHLADGLDENSVLSEEAMRGLNCLSLFAERLQGFLPPASASSGRTRCARRPTRRSFNARKGDPLPDRDHLR